MKRRYAIAVAAMIVATQLSGQTNAADPTLQELREISALLDANDVEGLRSYLGDRPALLEGESELAELLRSYMAESTDAIGFLGVARSPSADPDQGGDDGDAPGQLRAVVDALVASSPDDEDPEY